MRDGRIFVSSFASNVHRMQQAVDVAAEVGRKVCVIGRSMRKTMNISRSLGYIDIPDDMLLKPPTWTTTRAAGRSCSARGARASRSRRDSIAYNDHPSVNVERGDTVIISAKPIPGNELRVHDTINGLAKLGAEVLHEENAVVHVSGSRQCRGAAHRAVAGTAALRDARARRVPHAGGARQARGGVGVDPDKIVIAENGDVVELSATASGSPTGFTPA